MKKLFHILALIAVTAAPVLAHHSFAVYDHTRTLTLNGKVTILKLNVDENPATAAKYGVMSIPTLMLFKGGQLASRQVGAAPKQKLEQWITASV